MPSNLTGNFDLCIEISEQVLTAFAANKIGGQELNVPINTNFGGKMIVGSVHLLTQGVSATIDPQQKNRAAIKIGFAGSSIALTSPANVQAAPLGGSITVSAPFRLVVASSTPTSKQKQIQLDFTHPSVSVSVTFTTGSAQVQNLANQLGIPPALLVPAVNQLVQAALANMVGAVPLGPALTQVNSGDGKLTPPSFAQVAITTLPKSGNRPGVLCLLATVLASHVGLENVAHKTAIATDSSHSASISVSPEGFRDLIFCPGLAQAAGVNNVQSLCPTCGVAPQVNVKGLAVTNVAPSLQEGQVQVTGGAVDSGTGWDATINFAGHVTLSLSQGQIVPSVKVDSVDVDFDLAWWVYLLGGVFIPAVVQAGIEAAVNAAAKDALAQAIGNLQSVDITALAAQMQVDGVAVHTEGVVLQGKIATPVPTQLVPSLGLQEQDTILSQVQVAAGTVSNVNCTHNTYPYTDVVTAMQAQLQVTPHDLGLPSIYQWTVGGVALSGTSGTVMFSAKATNFDGTKTVTSTPHVDYQLSPDGQTLTLRNYPSDGSFKVDVECQVHDSLNQTAWAGEMVTFNGQVRQYGGTYAEDTANCLKMLKDAANKVFYPWPWPKLPIGPDPGPDRVAAQVLQGRFGAYVQPQVLADLGAIARAAGVQADWLTSQQVVVPIREIAKARG